MSLAGQQAGEAGQQAGEAEPASAGSDARKWWERIRDENPDFYARLFRSFTPEQWEARCLSQGVPSACEDRATLRRVAEILEAPGPSRWRR